MELNKLVANRIQTLREFKDWTQKDMGNAIGVSAVMVCNWEKGNKISLKHIEALSKATKCPARFFFTDDKDAERILLGKGKPEDVKDAAEVFTIADLSAKCHDYEKKLAKAEAELRGKDKSLEEMQAIIEAKNARILTLKGNEEKKEGGDIKADAKKMLDLSIKIAAAVAESL